MPFRVESLGRPSREHVFAVSPSATRAYAAATNDPIAAHTRGDCAPPVFAVVPVWSALIDAMAAVTPEEHLLKVVHGEQDMRFFAPLTPGMTLHSVATPIGVQVKPSGTTVVVRVTSHDDSGALVCEQYMTSFFRGVVDGDSGGEPAPTHGLDDVAKSAAPVASLTQHIDDDQTFRYADASGDRMPIHLDADLARAVGLPGIIVHGLCTMAFVSWAVTTTVGDGDPTRLRRLAVRFSRPVLPGQDITTRIWELRSEGGITTYGFETTNPDGEVVIKDGLAEVAGE